MKTIIQNPLDVNEKIKIAKRYAALGWHVLTMRTPEDPHPESGDYKVPYHRWKTDQTKAASPKKIKARFKRWPNANLGVATGAGSGIVVVDVDTPEAKEFLEHRYGMKPPAIHQITGREGGGWQYFYKHPGNGVEIKGGADIFDAKDRTKIDLRGDGGLVVVPPSRHRSGFFYHWPDVDPGEHGLDELEPMPEEFYTALEEVGKVSKNGQPVGKRAKTERKKKPGGPPEWVTEAMQGVAKGKRDSTGAKLAGYFIRGNSEDGTVAILEKWNKKNRPPMDNEQVLKIVKSIVSCVGMNKLSEITGKEIYQAEKLLYPDGEVEYRLYVENKDQPITLKAGDMTGQSRFETKFYELTDVAFDSVSRKEWKRLITQLGTEYKKVFMTEDETPIAPIRRIILSDISKGEYDQPENYIENAAIIYKGNVYFFLSTINRHLQYLGVKTKSDKHLGRLFRLMGFENKVVRINNARHRLWVMSHEKFMKKSGAED